MTWSLQSDGKEKGKDGAEEAEASRRENERFCSAASTEQGLSSKKKQNQKKPITSFMLFCFFPVAFVLINAVIQQEVDAGPSSWQQPPAATIATTDTFSNQSFQQHYITRTTDVELAKHENWKRFL